MAMGCVPRTSRWRAPARGQALGHSWEAGRERGGFPKMPSPVFSLRKPRRLWRGLGLPWLAGDPPPEAAAGR